MADTEENWLNVVGYEGCYEVSDRGRVRSCDRILNNGAHRKSMLRSLKVDRSGYSAITLRMENSIRSFSCHTLVAMAFLGEQPIGTIVGHLNGLRTDNRVENLCYQFKGESFYQAMSRGQIYSHVILTLEKVKQIKMMLSDSIAVPLIAAEYGVSKDTIYNIKLGNTWKKA